MTKTIEVESGFYKEHGKGLIYVNNENYPAGYVARPATIQAVKYWLRSHSYRFSKQNFIVVENGKIVGRAKKIIGINHFVLCMKR